VNKNFKLWKEYLLIQVWQLALATIQTLLHLELNLKNGGQIWQYSDFSESSYHEMMSDSIGKYFLANIKGHYTETRVG